MKRIDSRGRTRRLATIRGEQGDDWIKKRYTKTLAPRDQVRYPPQSYIEDFRTVGKKLKDIHIALILFNS